MRGKKNTRNNNSPPVRAIPTCTTAVNRSESSANISNITVFSTEDDRPSLAHTRVQPTTGSLYKCAADVRAHRTRFEFFYTSPSTTRPLCITCTPSKNPCVTYVAVWGTLSDRPKPLLNLYCTYHRALPV